MKSGVHVSSKPAYSSRSCSAGKALRLALKGDVGVPAPLAKGDAAKEVSGVPFLMRGEGALVFVGCDMAGYPRSLVVMSDQFVLEERSSECVLNDTRAVT